MRIISLNYDMILTKMQVAYTRTTLAPFQLYISIEADQVYRISRYKFTFHSQSLDCDILVQPVVVDSLSKVC